MPMLVPVDVSANSMQSFASAAATVYDDRIVLDYATVGELNQTILDEEQPIIADQTANFGYWSEFISDDNGLFETNPILTYQFKYSHRFNGIKIKFSDYVFEFKASFWLNNSKIYEKTYTPNSLDFTFEGIVKQYDKLIIECVKVLPHRFFKLSKLEFASNYNTAIFKPDRVLTGRVHFSLIDTKAKGDVSASDNGAKVGDISKTVDEIRRIDDYATVGELNQTILDTSQLQLPDDYSDINLGFWSSFISNENGNFDTNPLLTYTFGNYHSVVGISLITLDNILECKLRFYRGNVEIASKSFTGLTNKTSQLFIDVTNFNKIEVEIIKILPFRYFKLLEILFGIEYKYESNKYIKFEVLEELDPVGAEISSNELILDLDNINGQFNMFNPNSESKYLQELQPLKAEIDVKIDETKTETIKLGTFYLSQWQMLSQNTMRLVANDLIFQLNQPYRKSKFYENELAENIFLDLFNDCNLYDVQGNPLFIISDEIKSIRLTGYIPVKEQRYALGDICLACNAECKVNRDGILEIFRLNPLEIPYMDIAKDIAEYPLVNLLEVRKALSVGYYSYSISSDIIELFDGDLNGDVLVEYTTPNCTDIAVVGSHASYTAYANAIEIKGASGNTKITGKARVASKANMIVTNALEGYKETEVTHIEDVFLVTQNNVNSVANWILPYIEKRIVQKFKWWADPDINIGKNVALENRYGSFSEGIITKNHYIVRKGLSTETELLT